MLNRIWPWFIIISIIYSLFSGNIEEINTAVFDSSKSAINLSLVLFGSVALWSGLINIIKNTKLVNIINNIMKPFVIFLFPETRKNEELRALISMNIVSNFLGLGNAATPIGLKTIQIMHRENNEKRDMSDSMLFFILINTASIQLIPTTIFAIRKSLGSNNPNCIIIPVWCSTIVAAIAGITMLKILIRKNK